MPSGESWRPVTDWRASRLKGLRAGCCLRRASSSSCSAARSRTVSKNSFSSFFRYSWLALAAAWLAPPAAAGAVSAPRPPRPPRPLAPPTAGVGVPAAAAGRMSVICSRKPSSSEITYRLPPRVNAIRLPSGRESRIGFGVAGLGDLADLASAVVVDEQVAIAGEDGELLVARGVAARRAELVWPRLRSTCAGRRRRVRPRRCRAARFPYRPHASTESRLAGCHATSESARVHSRPAPVRA